MTEDLLGIGELARSSGLTVSALRFYDREGVLRPAVVDPATGYRRYAVAQVRPARLVAGMRRIGVPLANIAVVVDLLQSEEGADGGDVASVRGILADHLARLEDGLEDARREVVRLTMILDAAADGPGDGAWSVDAAGLADALAAVRFAVGSDPEFSVLHGVLLELDGPTCRLVATDRFRMAVTELAVAGSRQGGPTSTTTVVAPTAWVDAVLAAGLTGEVWISLSNNMIRLRDGAEEGDLVAEERLVPGDYPDHRRVLDHLPLPEVAQLRSGRAPGSATSLRMRDLGVREAGEGDATTLAARVRAASPRHTDEDGVDLVVLGLRDERLIVDEGPGVAVRREFLLDALDALEATGAAPVLRLDGPITPLVIRGDESTWSLLMPARLPEPAR